MSLFQSKPTLEDKSIDFLQGEKVKLHSEILKEQSKERPSRGKIQGLSIALTLTTELQNRILDDHWKE